MLDRPYKLVILLLLIFNEMSVSIKIGQANSLAVMLICAREFIVASVRSDKIFAANQLAKWKTVSQIAAVLMLLLDLPLANSVLWLAVILSLVSGGAYLWQSPLYRQLKSS